MTVFGARREQRAPSKPRFVGLALTAGLLVLLGLAALWSLVLDDNAESTLSDAPPETAAETAPVAQITPAEQPRDVPQTDTVAQISPAEPGPDVTQTAPTAPLPTAPETAADTTAPPAPEELIRLGENGTVKTADMVGVTSDTAAGQTATAETLAVDARLSEMTVEPAPLDPVAARAAYAATGIWQRAPEAGYLPTDDTLQDLEIASIDPKVLNQDAFALPGLDSEIDNRPRLPTTPRHPDTTEQVDDDGLVVPTEAGALSPGGVLIHSGRPFIVPPVRPDQAAITAAPVPSDNPLAKFRPRPRPGDLVETTEKANLGGLTRSELARLRPLARPLSAQETSDRLDEAARMADAETLESQEAALADVGPTPEEAALAVDLATATRRAVADSPMPRLRPANISQIAARARQQSEQEQKRLQEATARAAAEAARDLAAADQAALAKAARDKVAIQNAAVQAQREQAAAQQAAAQRAAQEQAARKKAEEEKARTAAAAARAKEAAAKAAAASAAAKQKGPAVSRSQRAKPTGPTPAAVAARATEKNAIALNRVSLIGVYGGSSQRRALVRLASGKYVKVKVGDRLDGGRVAAIGKSDLHYKKGSRTVTLKMPKG